MVPFTLKHSEYGKQLRKSLQAGDGGFWNRSERSARSVVAMIGSGIVPLFRFSPEGFEVTVSRDPRNSVHRKQYASAPNEGGLVQASQVIEYPDRI